MKKTLLTLVCIALGMNALGQTSPNGKLKAEAIEKTTLRISYKSAKGWQTIYEAETPGIKATHSKDVKTDYTMHSGKRLHCTNKARETDYILSDGTVLFVRAYDDGVAFRHVSNEAAGISGEAPMNISIPQYTHTWMMNWTDGGESFYPQDRKIKEGDRLSFPALFEFPNDVFGLLTEAEILRDNAASSFYSTDGKNGFRIQADQNEQMPQASSWRVMIVGSLSDVVESTLVTDVCSPCKLSDTSWIKPGVVSWVYWAYNHGSNDYNIIKKYVDFAATLKLPYVLIDAEWDEMKDGKTIEDAVKYAKEKGIDPLIWYNSCMGWIDGAPGPKWRLNKPEDREKEFAWCEEIGVKGVKVDFFGGDSNANMSYCIDLMESAARHHMTINFHGATLPRGWMRTYPNLLTTESVYGAEWYNNVGSFTDKAACHNATLPFTRNVIGSMDYTPCAFSDSQHPHITSHAHELALTALFESGLQHLADRPESFLAQPQSVQNYLSELPAVWNETCLLAGYPGVSVVMARRSGTTWYIAGINGTDEQKEITFDTKRLKGLGKNVTSFLDSGDKQNPWNITESNKVNTTVQCEPRGGFVYVVKK